MDKSTSDNAMRSSNLRAKLARAKAAPRRPRSSPVLHFNHASTNVLLLLMVFFARADLFEFPCRPFRDSWILATRKFLKLRHEFLRSHSENGHVPYDRSF